MAENSKIAWTEKTWNPIVGCSKVNEGCRNCYAERQAKRLKAMGQAPYQTVVDENGWTGKIALSTDRKFNEPLRTRKPTTFFVNSMSDLFHPEVTVGMLCHILDVITDPRCAHHTFQIATKRPERAAQMIYGWHNQGGGKRWKYTDKTIENIHLLFSASTQADLERGIGAHLATPAAVRGLSLEPLLGPIDLDEILYDDSDSHEDGFCYRGLSHPGLCGCKVTIDWVIVGCESGPKRRLNNVGERGQNSYVVRYEMSFWMSWLHDIIDQCAAAGVPVFVKQMPIVDGSKIGWRVSTDPSEWPEWARRQENPESTKR